MNIRVGTFNILNTSCRYQERKELVRDTIKQMDCDVLGLQEINYNENLELFDLETYNLYFASLPTPMLKSEPEFRIDGNAILMKKSFEVVSELKLVYSNQQRIAQILKVRKGEFEFFVVNTHLDHLSDSVRMNQVVELLECLLKASCDTCVCTGDYNFLPFDAPYYEIGKVFKSACFTLMNKEPQITFPTGLIGKFADIDEYGCFDYVWYKGQIVPTACSVVRNCGNGSIWASDHYPVIAEFQML